MSATNRGSKRAAHDFYATPEKVVSLFLQESKILSTVNGGGILEPSAGNGNIVKAIKQFSPESHVTAVELREEELENLTSVGSDSVIITNFLEEDFTDKFQLIIGNPPYSLAQEFVEKSISLLEPEGTVAMLLRVGFLGSKKRHSFFKKFPVSELYVCSARPSFTGKGTDASEYAWFIWKEGASDTSIKCILQEESV